MKKFLKELGRNRRFFLLTLFVGVVFSGIAVAVPTISGNLITAVVSDYKGSGLQIWALLLVSLFQILFSELDQYMSGTLKKRQKREMRESACHAFCENEGAGKEELSSFISFVNNDIPAISEQYFLGTIDILKCVSILLFSAVSLLYIHWILALIIVGISTLIVALPGAMREKGGEARKEYAEKLAHYNVLLQSILGGLRIVKAYRCRDYMEKTLSGADQEISESESVLIGRQLIVQGVTTVLQVCKTAAILITGIWLIAVGKIEVGSLVAAIQLAEVISAPIEVLAFLRHSRNEVRPLLKQYEEMAKLTVENGEGIPVENTGLSIDHLSYQIDNVSILSDVSVQFQAGQNYLITGGSGSGKSTLLRLIARIGDQAYRGKIFYNRADVKTLAYGAYYRKICPVFQEPYLFYGTLRENILLGRQITDEVYRKVVEKLGLSYLLCRYGEEEMTPERLEQLSGGERQRVALARAMVGNPDVYLLDEVTSALDRETAAAVEKLLLCENATVIHICHKPNPTFLSRYDAHFTLENGVLRPFSQQQD